MPKVTTDLAALILRLAAGAIFIPHGWSKIAGEGGAAAFATDISTNYGIPLFLGHLAAWSELVGAALLIVGLLTRLDALLLTGTMFTAAFIVQLPEALYEVPADAIKAFVALRAIELPLAMFAASVAILLIGPGRASLDHLFGIEARLGRLLPKKKAATEVAA
jgi:putative oxidoreductase